EKSSAAKTAEIAKPEQKPDAAKLEKSLAVLAKLKELEFHSRSNIEKLAELSLTIEDELKQKAFVESVGDVYSAQEAFHSTIAAVMVERALVSFSFPRSCSMCGPPTKIQRKHGVNVAQVVSSAPKVAASSGGKPSGCCHAPINPTNCKTMINGPGVVSASPSQSIICP